MAEKERNLNMNLFYCKSYNLFLLGTASRNDTDRIRLEFNVIHSDVTVFARINASLSSC